METTTVYWGYIGEVWGLYEGTLKMNMETTTVYSGCTGHIYIYIWGLEKENGEYGTYYRVLGLYWGFMGII